MKRLYKKVSSYNMSPIQDILPKFRLGCGKETQAVLESTLCRTCGQGGKDLEHISERVQKEIAGSLHEAVKF